MPNWNILLQAFAVLALIGFVLIIVSGFWRLLALIAVILLALIWLWHRCRH